MKELNTTELKKINGGESFAYRVGEAIRWLLLSQTIAGQVQLNAEEAN